jgi:hypothetical protein
MRLPDHPNRDAGKVFSCGFMLKPLNSQAQWLMLVILATGGVEVKRITVQSQLWQKSSQDPISGGCGGEHPNPRYTGSVNRRVTVHAARAWT